MKKPILTLLLALAVAAPLHAQVKVEEPWVRATVPQQGASGAFMKLTSAQAARLVAVESPIAGVTEIHEMKMDGNVMRMRAVEMLMLPAGETVELKSGGFHVMLLDLKEQIRAGETIPLTLTIEHGGGERERIEVSATARSLTYQHGGKGHHGH